MADDPRLAERLNRANEKLRVSSAARKRHRSTIAAELQAPTIPAVVKPRSGQRHRRLALIAATILIGPIAALLASSGAIPGDTLYPAKRAVERVVSVFDNETTADHRLDELEQLIRRESKPSAISDAQDEAFSAIEGFSEGHPFIDRYRYLVLGARQGEAGLDLDYRQRRIVRWSEGERYRISLPTGDLVRIDRSGDDFQLTATGDWVIDRLVGERWFVSDQGIGVVGSTIFELRVIGDEVEAVLLNELPIVGGPNGVEVESTTPVRPDVEPDRNEDPPITVEAEAGSDSTDDQSDDATVPSPTTETPTTTATTPEPTQPETTEEPTTTTVTTALPTQPPPTEPPPTAPPTTCGDDDDDEDEDECDD